MTTAQIFGATRTTQRLYLALGPFREEIDAVVDGERCFTATSGKAGENALYTLRRNTHRLEKGLIMRPRRPVFALDYIEETVKAFATLSATCDQYSHDVGDALEWGRDVLNTYFEAVDVEAEPHIVAAKSSFKSACEGNRPNDNTARVPFLRPTDSLGISVEKMQALAIRRRSCRWYKDQRVPRELIDKAMDVARFSPSACNRQPFRFVIFDDPNDAAEVGAIPYGTAGFSHRFPCFIVIVGTLAAFPFPRDRHVIYVDASLAAMAFQFALEVQGIGSCCINWPDLAPKNARIAKRLGLKSHERVVMCMSLGYPDESGMVPYSQKKNLDELREYQSQ